MIKFNEWPEDYIIRLKDDKTYRAYIVIGTSEIVQVVFGNTLDEIINELHISLWPKEPSPIVWPLKGLNK